MKSRFDRLYKTIFESVKPRPSKNNLNRILKEDVNDANTPESITPEQRATIEKVVAKLCAEKEDFRDTVEFAKLDTDFFVMLLDDCYEDWLEDQGYDEEQPDMFDEVPDFEQFAYGSIKDYLQDYDADDEGTADMIVSNFYDLEKELFLTEFIQALKPQIETFKAACKKLINRKGDDIFYLYHALTDIGWWDKNGLKYSPELKQKINELDRRMSYIYNENHILSADIDWDEWDYPEEVLKGLGLYVWYMSKDPLDLLESKKVDTSKKVIKESARRHVRRIRK